LTSETQKQQTKKLGTVNARVLGAGGLEVKSRAGQI